MFLKIVMKIILYIFFLKKQKFRACSQHIFLYIKNLFDLKTLNVFNLFYTFPNVF